MASPQRRLRGPKPMQSQRFREAVAQAINSGQWPPGFLLPVERDLAARFRMSQPTIHRELGRLIAAGVLSVDADGRRVVSGATSRLMARTIILFTQYEAGLSQLHAPGQVLPQWDSSLELIVQRYLLAAGWRPWCLPATSLSDAELDHLQRDPPVGAVLFATNLPQATRDRLLSAVRRSRTPMAAFASPEECPGCDTIGSDHRAGGRSVVEWMIHHGCRQLVTLARPDDPEPMWHAQRQLGYREGAALAPGIPLTTIELGDVHGMGDTEAQRLASQARVLMRQLHLLGNGPRPIGVLTLSDGQVPAVWQACRMLGWHPGRDLFVAGYDGYWGDIVERAIEPLPPSVSTDKRHGELGQGLAELLLQRIGRRDAGAPRHVVIPPHLTEPGRILGT